MAPWGDRLSAWLAHPGRAGILTDFDGTLAPIVADPAAAVALPGVSDALVALAARYARVAVISGRPVAYLLDRLPAAAAGGSSSLASTDWNGSSGDRWRR